MTLPRVIAALAVTLVVALIVAKFSAPDDLGRNVALLIGSAMCLVLAGSNIAAYFGNDLGTAVRYALIWGGLLALVALAYTNKASFGF